MNVTSMLGSMLNLAGPDFLIILFLGLVLIFILPAILQWLWNMTIPQVFGLRPILFWQAFRLMIICGILFGRFSR
jgi:hypothetical protein